MTQGRAVSQLGVYLNWPIFKPATTMVAWSLIPCSHSELSHPRDEEAELQPFPLVTG